MVSSSLLFSEKPFTARYFPGDISRSSARVRLEDLPGRACAAELFSIAPLFARSDNARDGSDCNAWNKAQPR
jgi:hypothetical protein